MHSEICMKITGFGFCTGLTERIIDLGESE